MGLDRFKDWYSEFCATGHIAPLQLGMTQRKLAEKLGEPSDYGALDGRGRPQILRYERMEFHFDLDADSLVLIYQEHESGGVQVSIPLLGPA